MVQSANYPLISLPTTAFSRLKIVPLVKNPAPKTHQFEILRTKEVQELQLTSTPRVQERNLSDHNQEIARNSIKKGTRICRRKKDPVEMFPSFNRQQVDDGSLNHLHMVGSMIVNVVTFGGYAGTWGQPEMVELVRDESNPYNPNAIEVLNRESVLLGYLEYSAAAVLSPLIDTNLIIIKGFAQSNNEFEVVCQVCVFARLTEFERVKLAISTGELVILESNASQPVAVKEKNHVPEEKSVDEIFKLLSLEVCSKGTVEPLEPPKSMIKPELFPHQKEGLGWLVSRENSCKLPPFWKEKNGVYVNEITSCHTYKRPQPIRGGIFADDVGLGKTLILLSLIAYDKWTRSGCSSGNVEVEINEEQVEENIGKKAKRGRGSISASKKKQKAGDLNVNEMRPPFAFDKPCDSLEPRATLIVSSLSVLSSWVSQLEEHIRPGSLKVYTYYGERTKVVEELQDYDIVLTTYNTLASEFSKSPLLKIEWRRVILDEAHIIKNVKAHRSCTVHELKAKRRWAVTGRPIQNNIFDLFSIMVFLKFEPFSIQQHWDSLIQSPLSQGDYKGISRLQVLVAYISLRRTKEKCLVILPSKSIEIHPVILTKEEREEYDRMEVLAKKHVEGYISDDSKMSINYSTILSILIRLRQMCTNMALCPADLRVVLPPCKIEDAKNNPRLLEKLLLVLEDGEDFDCPICLSPPTDIVITCCAHIFCRSCILKTIKQGKKSCPMCRHPLSQFDLFKAPSESSEAASFCPSSSKVTALLQLLSASRDLNPSTKSVIFSQFRKLLLLLEEPLKEAGFKFLHLDGALNGKNGGAKVIKRFGVPAPEGPTILLASLRASAGINLTAASRVYLMEPSWNPEVEEQAMNRVHCIGQKEDVKIIRFIATNTIDERLLRLQERKKTIPTTASGKKRPKDRKELTREDLRALMNL